MWSANIMPTTHYAYYAKQFRNIEGAEQREMHEIYQGVLNHEQVCIT